MVGLQTAHGRRKIAKLSLLTEDKIHVRPKSRSPTMVGLQTAHGWRKIAKLSLLYKKLSHVAGIMKLNSTAEVAKQYRLCRSKIQTNNSRGKQPATQEDPSRNFSSNPIIQDQNLSHI
jgi:hypothetical protein